MKTTAKKAAPKKSVITRMRERSIDRIVQGVDAISERLSLIESSVAVIRSEHMNDEVERASSHAYDAWNECRAISVTLNKVEGSVHSHGSSIAIAIDRLVQRLTAIEDSVAEIRSGATFMQQLEQDAPDIAAKERDDKLNRLVFGVRVMTPNRGEGIYWMRKRDDIHTITVHNGSCDCTTDELTLID